MRLNKVDIVAPEYITVIGKRQEVAAMAFGEAAWQVFAQLTNHSEFIFGSNATEEEANELLESVLYYACHSDLAFVSSTEGDHVNIFGIVRYYVDGEANARVALIEDRNGKSWPIYHGSEAECREAIHRLSKYTLHLEQERKEQW